MAFYEIPTGPSPRTITVALGASSYTLRLDYADTPEGGWFMDIANAAGNALVCGIPLVIGADLLGQYRYLGIPVLIFVVNDDGSDLPPSFTELGSTSHLLYADISLSAVVEAYFQARADAFAALFAPHSGNVGSMAIGVGRIGVSL